ncbi:M15 family metallopeptidase [Sporosarcina highlanderae]|uniref:D-alanyl-D-alanine carboxypeptidase family protein n=1 Tax=Sporosarcina highlanderae TaxID=3035916 RepID=A0ABT8JN33_9BACL|nr:D-alanyl-D-alanine carboxypeptidase family protein [Sporosarcina highlanderae]MDN4606352.1 D-alanyl-D-alanine carboxypeptidase family protein [Sporosarcina highlanderae]
MNRKRRSTFSKKSNKALTITLLLVGIFMTAIVVWVGMNDWDVNKSLKQIGIEGPEKQPLIVQEPEETEEPIDPLEPEIEEDTDDESPSTVDEPLEEEPNAEVIEEPKKDQKKEVPEKSTPKTEDKSEGTTPQVNQNKSGYIEGQTLPDKPTYVKGILIANKRYPLPSTFAPGESKEARDAFEEMSAEAKLSGINLTAFSTYRSYEYQVSLYDRYVKKDGVERADQYSARPGYSEHQTGLAFDIGEVNYEKHWASSSFGETEAGKWVAANAHRYGFIMRYPKGKEEITGYMYEAWHFRYVGEEIAEEIFKRNVTLEEYLGLN